MNKKNNHYEGKNKKEKENKEKENKESHAAEKNEFAGLLCNLYMIALLAVLPLYTGEGYWKLGDTKYILFRNVSFLCLGFWLVLKIWEQVRIWARALWNRKPGKHLSVRQVREGMVRKKSFSVVDLAVAAYGCSVAASALCSSYGTLAWNGYNEWYMGAVSQFMFVGIYFFVSRQYDGSQYPLYMGVGAFGLVTLFGLLHRLGIDPLGLQTGWNNGDWEYNHMLSTLGNINWLCGFYSVALAWLLVNYFREKRRSFQVAAYMAALGAYVLLGIQGSQGGLLILGVSVVVCFLLGWGQKMMFRKLTLLLAGFFLCMPFIDWLTKLREEMAAVAADGNVFDHVVWYAWFLAAAACIVLYFISLLGLFHRLEDWIHRSIKRNGWLSGKKWFPGKGRQGILPVFGLSAGVVLIVCCLLWGGGSGGLFGIEDSFGSGRGFLWRIGAEGFARADWKEKLLGAGPDCYGEAVFRRLGEGTDVWNGEHWEGAIFTNAHNEMISQLINVGIIGTICYLAIFLAGIWRYCFGGKQLKYGRWMGTLAIVMYGAHAMISFQQVLNAPLFFLTLGLCEYGMRETSSRGPDGK